MNLNDAFPSKWLKADSSDFAEGDLILTIEEVALEKMKDNGVETNKLILSFKEIEKQLIANKTNCKIFAKLHGGDTDDWIGKRVALYATEVEYAGETMLGIRVRLTAPRPVGKAAAPAPANRTAGPQGFGVPKKPAPATVPADDFDMNDGGDAADEAPF